jgi:hypothetical protein
MVKMGWAKGSDIYEIVIKVLEKYIPDYKQRKDAHKKIIEAFGECDWDPQNECMGQDVAYDDALIELYPDWDW